VRIIINLGHPLQLEMAERVGRRLVSGIEQNGASLVCALLCWSSISVPANDSTCALTMGYVSCKFRDHVKFQDPNVVILRGI
jgi:hypothetical protein